MNTYTVASLSVYVAPVNLGTYRAYSITPAWTTDSWHYAANVREARQLAQRMITHRAKRGAWAWFRPWGVRFRYVKGHGSAFRVSAS